MKRLTVILLLAAQIGLLFNKGFTVLYFFLHRAEIIEHFCHHATHEEEENCQGICYLKAEMSKEDNSPVENFPVNSLVQDEVVYFEMLPVFKLIPLIVSDKTTNNYIVHSPILQNTHLSVWRPPTAA